MFYIPKIDEYLKIVTDEEVVIDFSEYFKSIREEQNLREAAKLLLIFLTTSNEVTKYAQSNYFNNCIHRYNVKMLNIFDPELKLSNTKPMIKSKLKEFLSKSKNFKA